MLKAPNSPGGPLARYNALNVPDQTVFQALSILYEPASAVVVTAVLNGAGLRESPLRSFTPQNVLLRLRRLDQAGLADAAAGGETGREAARLLWKARPREAELALRHAVRDGAFAALARSALSAARGRDWRDEGAGRSARRNLRLAFHGGDWDAARRECLLLGAERGGAGGEFLSALIDAQPDELWMRRGSPAALAGLAESALRDVFSGLGDPRTLVGTMGKLAADHPALALGLARAAFLRGGEADWAGAVFAETGARIRLLAAFRSGDDRLALECAGLALAERRRGGGRDATLDGLEGVAQVLAAIRSGGRGGLERAVNNLLAPAAQSHEYAGALRALRHAALHFLGQSFPARTLPALAGELPQGGHPLTVFIHGLASWWIDPARLEALCPALRALAGRADAGGWRWLAAQLDGLAAKASAGGAGAPPWPLLADAFPEQEEWRRSLGALAELARDGGDPEAQKRLAWLVGGDGWGGGAEVFSLQPVEQTRGKDGTWTRGRNIALRKVFHHPEMFPHAGDRDRLVFSALRYAEADGFHFEPGLALESLVGHPLVFRDDASGARIDVERGVFELTALDRDGGCDIALEPPLADFPPAAGGGAPDRDLPPVLARFESPCRLRVYKLDQRSRRLTMVVGPGLSIPAPGREDALRALGLLAGKVHVHSDLPELAAGGARVEADPRPRFHLLPRRPGLDVELWAHPLGDDGPAYRPGRGGRILAAGSGDGAVAALRDLDREKTLAAGAAGACPSLAGREAGDWSWRLEDPEVCLAFLAEAGALGERAVLAWPRGGRFRVRRVRGAGDLSLRLAGGGNDWLGLDGALRVDENLVVGMADLLAALGRSSGRFVEIGDGEYIALSEELARQLRDLEALTRRRDGELALSSLAAAAVEGFAELGADVRADRAWRETLARREALDAFSPGPPDGFGAELRDYQLAGYRWLARLAEWGAGACLADDMGLGKTIQALAVLVRRAELGPALVVAPTSVCHNWIAETRRFAPALRPVAFGEGDRERTLSRLGPGDLFVTSYGLLQQEEELFSGVAWAAAVLDEAQAIKNAATKRSRAAMKLKAGFRCVTTGTPIENHLGELWNLFRFINPHLLGSWRHFQERFADPIERGGDAAARDRLRRVIRPFVLRRLKSQVLAALPPKTEITLRVELGRRERAFYEALRREALERLDGAEGGPEERRIQALAEIMRLRRACCSPELVTGDAALPSAKQEQFDQTLRELLENNHQALVFSQFVSHLAIIRRRLDAGGIRYRYLDGATPAKRRQEEVRAFQDGDGDVFLISLKAGGLGLNLTAADYVIHMDPWWNPAAEDQASDRAHRIGQLRPVTVYRLVAADTIEERIVDLHRRKRQLAEDLLAGSDQSARLDLNEMLRLLREDF